MDTDLCNIVGEDVIVDTGMYGNDEVAIVLETTYDPFN